MKREKPKTVLLAEINACLQEPISAKEKRIFLLAKRYLEKKKISFCYSKFSSKCINSVGNS
ncbi:hypothetical protein F5ESL0233_04270 [Lactobacillus sp. ESL0233]|nr:hypothetical protein F5ESL0233_04270 [Lactobacillus sp. ESL0233]